MKKRVLAIVLSVFMAACMTACGDSTSTADANSSSKADSSSQAETTTTKAAVTTTTSGKTKEQPTTTTTSAAKESSKTTPDKNGKYTYTVYGDIELTMDVNIDDYIFTNDNGKKVFRFFDMAIDLGWWVGTGGGKPIDPATFGKTYTGWENAYHTEPKEFFWNTKDGVIQYVFERMKKKDKDPRYTWSQLEYFSLLSVTWGVSSRNVCSAYIGKHYDDDEYIATNIVDFVVSRNDIIILAYVFSTVPKNPEKDPFAGTGLERYHKNDYRLP